MLTAVGGDFDTRDATSSAGVGVSRDGVGGIDVGGQVEGFVVIGGYHGRVDVEFVEDVLGLQLV